MLPVAVRSTNQLDLPRAVLSLKLACYKRDSFPHSQLSGYHCLRSLLVLSLVSNLLRQILDSWRCLERHLLASSLYKQVLQIYAIPPSARIHLL